VVRSSLGAAVVALVLVLTGCGSGGSNGPEPQQIELARQANIICAQRAVKVKAALARRGDNFHTISRALPALVEGAQALAALEPPPKAARPFGYFVGEELEQIDRIRAALRGRLLAHSGRRDQATWLRSHLALAAQLGFTRCIGAGDLPTFGGRERAPARPAARRG
jgi:hypothetical protein